MLQTLWGWLAELGQLIYDIAAKQITELHDAFPWLLDSLNTLCEWVLDALVYIIKAVPYLMVDGVLTAIKTFVSALDVSAIVLQFAAGYGLIPPQAAYFMCAIGFPQFVSMIAAAYAVRFLLNLTPIVQGTGLPQI